MEDTQVKNTRHRLSFFKNDDITRMLTLKFGVYPLRYVRALVSELFKSLPQSLGYYGGINMQGFGKIYLSKVPPRKSYCPSTKTYHEHPPRLRAYIKLEPEVEKMLLEKWDQEVLSGKPGGVSGDDQFDEALQQSKKELDENLEGQTTL